MLYFKDKTIYNILLFNVLRHIKYLSAEFNVRFFSVKQMTKDREIIKRQVYLKACFLFSHTK